MLGAYLKVMALDFDLAINIMAHYWNLTNHSTFFNCTCILANINRVDDVTVKN